MGTYLGGVLVLACGDGGCLLTSVCACGPRIPALFDWLHLPWWLSCCHDAVCSSDCCLVSEAICPGSCVVTMALSALSGDFCLVMMDLFCFGSYDSLLVSSLPLSLTFHGKCYKTAFLY